MKKKILFFSPHTSIWVHSLPEAQIAKYLSENFLIDCVYCDHDFSDYCVAMSSVRLDQSDDISKKQEICSDCIRKQKILKLVNPTLNYHTIKNFVEKDYRIEARELSKAISISDLLDYELDGIKIGIYSQYEILLQYKKSNFHYSHEEEKSARINFYNTLISFRAATNYFKSNTVAFMIVYNYLYAVNHVWKKVAEKNNTKVYIIYAGENLANRINTIQLSQNQNVRLELKKVYKELLNLPFFEEKYIESIVSHSRELLSGEHFYAYSSASSGKDMFSFFGLDSSRKTVLAAMSSYDERFASEEVDFFNPVTDVIFKTQKEWAMSLIEFFSNKEEYQLILRVHPREFPNKRDSIRSKHSVELEELFQKLPANVKINYPTDNLSIYEVAMNMHCVLSAWSSVGEELALYGIPILIYNEDLIAYPPNLNYLETTKEKYFRHLEEMLIDDSFQYEKIKHSMRWYAVKFASPFKILKNFHRHENPKFSVDWNLGLWKRLIAKNKIDRIKKQISLYPQEILDIKDFFSFHSEKNAVNRVIKENLSLSIKTRKFTEINEKEEDIAVKKTMESVLSLLLKADPKLVETMHVQKLKKHFAFN